MKRGGVEWAEVKRRGRVDRSEDGSGRVGRSEDGRGKVGRREEEVGEREECYGKWGRVCVRV